MDINQITDEHLRAYLTAVVGVDTPPGEQPLTVADEIGIDEDFSSTDFDFAHTTDRLVHAVFGADADPPLGELPPGCDVGFDLIADGDGVPCGGRFLLYPPRSGRISDRCLPVLASGCVESKRFGDRDLTGLDLAVSILHDAGSTIGELLDTYQRLAVHDTPSDPASPDHCIVPGNGTPEPRSSLDKTAATPGLDPDEALRIMRVAAAMTRRIAARGTEHVDECWLDLAEAAHALDTWLSEGGRPPRSWA